MYGDISRIIGKEFVYDLYNRIVDEPKNYEKITRKKMIQEIFVYYQKDDNLEKCLTYHDILDLREMMEVNSVEIKSSPHLYQLLLLDCIDYKHYCINEEIFPFIKEKINTYDLEEAKQRDERNNLIIGMIKGYGIIEESNFDQILHIFNELNKTDFELERDVFCNRIVREYYIIEEGEFGVSIVCKIFEDYFQELIEIQNANEFHLHFFDYDVLINIAKYNFDISIPSLKKLYKEIQDVASIYVREEIMKILLVLLNFGKEYNEIKKILSNFPLINSFMLPKMLTYIKAAMVDIPLAVYNGMSHKEMRVLQKKSEESLNYLQSSKQSGACLGTKEASRFYKMYFGLLDYVNNKYKIVEEHNLITARYVNPASQVAIRNILFDDLSIIDEYVESNPNQLNATVLKQVLEIKNAILTNCMIVKYERNCTLIVGDNNIFYGVIGGVCNMDEIIDADDIPYMCKFALIPYKGKIVYDGVMEGVSVKFGSGIKTNIVNDLKGAKIHKSLLPIVN